MQFETDKIYHIYNRSNETIFYNERNYNFFIYKVKKLIYPLTDIIAWCLMPNHFHFLIAARKGACLTINESHRPNVQSLLKNIGTLLSSYTKAINKQYGKRGKLFTHNTKAKCLNDFSDNNYLKTCFFYIHQNPITANLCNDLADWPYSSFNEFIGLNIYGLVNKKLALEIINYDPDNFKGQCLVSLDEKRLKGVFL
ncbi:transposase [Bacteroidota bacterium]